MTTEPTFDLAAELELLRQRAPSPRMPPARLRVRMSTSPWIRALLPTRLMVRRAVRRGRWIWKQSAVERDDATAVMQTIVAGTPRAHEVAALARLQLIESKADAALFWRARWPTPELDPRSALRLREALSADRGVLLSASHIGPFYCSMYALHALGRRTYVVGGPWFFESPSHDYWGRRLARFRKGGKSIQVRSEHSFTILRALLEAGELVYTFFDMPGPRRTSFLGKQVTLADGTARLALAADALALPVRARRAGHRVCLDVAGALDPRAFDGVDELHEALAEVHERWILELPEAMSDPRSIGWHDGATPQGWTEP